MIVKPPLFRKRLCTYLFCSLLLFLFSCNAGNDTVRHGATSGTPIDSSEAPVRDAAETAGDDDPYHFDRYKGRAHLDLKNYVISIHSGYYDSDSLREPGTVYPERNLLVVRNKLNSRSDTMRMETSDQLDDVNIKELSDSLHLPSLFLQIEWTGDSDVPWSEFVGYRSDTLNSLFTIPMVVSLRRSDAWTLTGFTGGRDELVGNFQYDYPIIVSLKDFSVSEQHLPRVQYIGYSSTALESIKGYRVINSKNQIPYTIKKGQQVLVDTLYREAGRVRLIVSDSIIIHTRLEEAKGKLQENTAG